MIKLFLFKLIILSLCLQTKTQINAWKLASTKDDIKAYTRKVDHSKYLEYKIETQISSTVDDVLTLLTDTKQSKKIFPYLSEIELLRDELPESFDVLVVIKTPFPVKNRIGVYTNHISRSQENKQVKDRKSVV